MSATAADPDAWCSVASRASGEPQIGTAPRADVWVVVEHAAGWGDAHLTRSEHGVRVVMARPMRGHERPPQAWVAYTGPHPHLRRARIGDPAEVAAWDLAAVAAGELATWGSAVHEPLLLVCANGRRDRCCGHAGRRLARELGDTPAAGVVLTSTHLGGHRFSPTALLLPWGVLHGRLDRAAALAILTGARIGSTPEATLRGHSALSAPEQVAEAHARRVTGYSGLAPLPVSVEIAPGGSVAIATVTTPSGARLAARLRRDVVDVLASCGKSAEPTARWVVDP